jgi:integrase/recombinase XerD
MGHTDIAVTENHYHRNRKSIERKVEILSAIPEFSML